MVKYLITSGNSNVGRAALNALKYLGESDVVAGARKPAESEAELKKAGASSVVELDLNKPETIEKALEGVEKVLIVHGRDENQVLIQWTQNVIDAAKRPGSKVKVLGKIAGIFADSKSAVPVIKTHGHILDLLGQSGFLHFSIGPTFNMENWFRLKNDIKAGAVIGAANDTKSAYVAVDDIGAAAVSALRNPEKYNGKHLNLCGDMLNEAAMLKAITDATGIAATYKNLTPAEYDAYLKDQQVPADLAVMMPLWENLKRSGAMSHFTTDLLRELLGREPLTATAWAAKNASYFK